MFFFPNATLFQLLSHSVLIRCFNLLLNLIFVGIDDTDDSTFTISVEGKTFHFRAADADDRDRWARSLEETIYRPPALHSEK